jgi:hypothetical protein
MKRSTDETLPMRLRPIPAHGLNVGDRVTVTFDGDGAEQLSGTVMRLFPSGRFQVQCDGHGLRMMNGDQVKRVE